MRAFSSLCAVILISFAVGCGNTGSSEGNCNFQPTQNLNSGLTIYKASGGELCGSYRSGENAIHFQTVRGEDLVLGVNTIDPDAPAYAVSARILDQDGNPIAVAIGGHDDRISSWLEKVDGLGSSNPDLSSTFALAQEATDALSKAAPSGFEEEINVLKRRSVTAAPEVSSSKLTNKMQTLSSTWRYWIRIFRKDAFFNGSPADHSAVIVNVTRPDGWMTNYVTCNHGTCADDPAMQYKCQNLVYPATQRPFAILPCDSVSSYGLLYGQHVCNDDTQVQYNMIVYNNSSLATCTDWPAYWAPACN